MDTEIKLREMDENMIRMATALIVLRDATGNAIGELELAIHNLGKRTDKLEPLLKEVLERLSLEARRTRVVEGVN